MDIAGGINSGLRRVPAWLIYIAGVAYAVWEFWRALNQFGPYLVEPINVLERTYGEIALKLLVLGLMVTPLREWAGINLLTFRRAIGVTAFFQDTDDASVEADHGFPPTSSRERV